MAADKPSVPIALPINEQVRVLLSPPSAPAQAAYFAQARPLADVLSSLALVQHRLADLPVQAVGGGGWAVEVRPDAGSGKGKGLFATQASSEPLCTASPHQVGIKRWRLQDFEEGDVIFTEKPLVAAQDKANKAVAFVCSHCFRHLGSIEAQIARRLLPGGDAAGSSQSPAPTECSGRQLLFGRTDPPARHRRIR